VVADLAGADAALASERTYVRKTLPEAVVRELSALFRGDLNAAGRLAAIGAGLALTGGGYTVGRLRYTLGRETSHV
jgi:hypothetical protein